MRPGARAGRGRPHSPLRSGTKRDSTLRARILVGTGFAAEHKLCQVHIRIALAYGMLSAGCLLLLIYVWQTHSGLPNIMPGGAHDDHLLKKGK